MKSACRGWLALWAAQVLNKVEVHGWRLAKNGLAVGSELQRQQIKLGVRCVACNREETLLHRFWSCPHAARLWDLLRDHSKLQLRHAPHSLHGQRVLSNWLLEWMGGLKEDELALQLMMLYQLWQATARRTLHLVEEWRNLKVSTSSLNGDRQEER